jgi:hypothetical protein
MTSRKLSTFEGGGFGTCACTDEVDEITRMASNNDTLQRIFL